MSIIISEIPISEYSKACHEFKNKLPLWLQDNYTSCYSEKLILVAKKGSQIVGLWIVPLIKSDSDIIAKRSYRFFPYTSPYLLVEDNLQRREVTQSFFLYLKGKVTGISLPMHPDFVDLPVLFGLGMFIEWRHTHILHSKLDINLINSRLRNNINSARHNVKILISRNHEDFIFEKAIRGQSEEINKRKALAIELLKDEKAVIIAARDNDNVLLGGVFIMYDELSAYSLHSWKSENAPRGINSLLLYEGINWVFTNTKLGCFDFEGSVIQDIDYFYTGFNAQITPYGFVHWAENFENLSNQINNAMNIEGRVFKN